MSDHEKKPMHEEDIKNPKKPDVEEIKEFQEKEEKVPHPQPSKQV